MRTTTSLKFSKSVHIQHEGTYMEEQERYLDCELTVKGNNADETAHLIMDIIERELRSNGYDFQFSGCPTIENGEYWDCISILFESGYMTEYKEAVKEAYKVAKEEIKGNAEAEADKGAGNQIMENERVKEMELKIIEVQQDNKEMIYIFNNGCYVIKYKSSNATNLFDKEGNYITKYSNWVHNSDAENAFFKMVIKYRGTKGDMEYLRELLEDIFKGEFTYTDVFHVIDLIKEYGDYQGAFLYEVQRYFDRIKNYEEAKSYINDMINNDPNFLKMVKAQGNKTLEINKAISNVEPVAAEAPAAEGEEETTIEVIAVEEGKGEITTTMTLNNGYTVESSYGIWTLYDSNGEYVTQSREWNTSDLNKHMIDVADTYRVSNGTLHYMMDLFMDTIANRELMDEFQALLELLIEFNNNTYFKEILDTYHKISEGEETREYVKGLKETKDFMTTLTEEFITVVEKNSKFLIEEVNMGLIEIMKKSLLTTELEPVEVVEAEKKYSIWLGVEDIKGKQLEVGQQVRIDLYNMSVEELEELKGVDYREVQEGHSEKNYTRMYIEIVAIYPQRSELDEIFINEVYHHSKGWIEEKKSYKLYQVKEMFVSGIWTTVNIKEDGASFGKDYHYKNFSLYYPIETK